MAEDTGSARPEKSGITRRQLLKRGGGAAAVLGTGGFAAFLAACERAASPSAGASASAGATFPPSQSGPGVLTVGLSAQSFETMDGLASGVTVSQGIYEAMYDHLVKVDTLNGGELLPELATEWAQVDDVTWDFTLREGVTFWDGEPFNAETAVHSLRLVLDDPANWLQSRIGGFASVEAVDDRTLRVVTSAPDVLTVGNISQIPMYPKAYYESVGASGFAKAPMGTGPFKFESWTDDIDVTLVRNDDYWGDVPAFDKVIFKPLPEPANRLSALLAGEIDLAYNLNIDDTTVLEQRGFLPVPAPVGQGTGINLLYLGDQDPENPMSNKLVRQAMNYAVDKDAIVENILLSSTRALQGQLVGPDCFGFNPDIEAYPFDQDRARELLAEAGYPDGFTIDFESSAENYSKAREVSENLVAQLAEVGITVNLSMLEWNLYLDKLLEATGAPMFYVGWNYYPVMDANFAIQHFLSDSIFKLAANEEMDAIYAEETNEFDRDRREGLLKDFMAVMREEAPFLFLFQSPLLYGLNPRVTGFPPTADDHPHVDAVALQD